MKKHSVTCLTLLADLSERGRWSHTNTNTNGSKTLVPPVHSTEIRYHPFSVAHLFSSYYAIHRRNPNTHAQRCSSSNSRGKLFPYACETDEQMEGRLGRIGAPGASPSTKQCGGALLKSHREKGHLVPLLKPEIRLIRLLMRVSPARMHYSGEREI